MVALIGSRRFSPSIYESIIEARRLPYLPTLKQFALDGNVSDVMEPAVDMLPQVTTISTLIRVLSKSDEEVLPVVLGPKNKFFIGSIQRHLVERYVRGGGGGGETTCFFCSLFLLFTMWDCLMVLPFFSSFRHCCVLLSFL